MSVYQDSFASTRKSYSSGNSSSISFFSRWNVSLLRCEKWSATWLSIPLRSIISKSNTWTNNIHLINHGLCLSLPWDILSMMIWVYRNFGAPKLLNRKHYREQLLLYSSIILLSLIEGLARIVDRVNHFVLSLTQHTTTSLASDMSSNGCDQSDLIRIDAKINASFKVWNTWFHFSLKL